MKKLLNIANQTINNVFTSAGLIKNNFRQNNQNSELIKVINRKNEQLPQYDYLFVVSMPDVFEGPEQTEAVMGEYDLRSDSYSTGGKFLSIIDPVEINHRVFSIDIPFRSFETGKHAEKSAYWYSAKHNDIGSINMRLDEMEDNATLTYLQTWMKRIMNPDGTYNPPAFYKRSIRVIRLSGSKEELTVSDYIGCFPVSIADSSLSNDSGGILQYSVTLSVDNVVHRTETPATIKKAISEIQDSIKENSIPAKSGLNLDDNIAAKLLERFATIYF